MVQILLNEAVRDDTGIVLQLMFRIDPERMGLLRETPSQLWEDLRPALEAAEAQAISASEGTVG